MVANSLRVDNDDISTFFKHGIENLKECVAQVLPG